MFDSLSQKLEFFSAFASEVQSQVFLIDGLVKTFDNIKSRMPPTLFVRIFLVFYKSEFFTLKKIFFYHQFSDSKTFRYFENV
jgi:hypothetical protein